MSRVQTDASAVEDTINLRDNDNDVINNSAHRDDYHDFDDYDDDDDSAYDGFLTFSIYWPELQELQMSNVLNTPEENLSEEQRATIANFINYTVLLGDHHEDAASSEESEDFVPRNLFIVADKPLDQTTIINEDCCICLDKLDKQTEKQISQIDTCQHGFCSDCLFNWLKEHSVCPVCRTPCVKINLCK